MVSLLFYAAYSATQPVPPGILSYCSRPWAKCYKHIFIYSLTSFYT